MKLQTLNETQRLDNEKQIASLTTEMSNNQILLEEQKSNVVRLEKLVAEKEAEISNRADEFAKLSDHAKTDSETLAGQKTSLENLKKQIEVVEAARWDIESCSVIGFPLSGTALQISTLNSTNNSLFLCNLNLHQFLW